MMKLIEKLARDYYNKRPEGFGEPTEDFMAGFRAAREMAAKIVFREVNDRTPAAAIVFIKQMGEQEVEG